jgi:phosphoglycolate phosphatase-like HAD superfamily hydrolase
VGTALVIENDATDDLRRLGEWLSEAGLELTVLSPHPRDALPHTLDRHQAQVVLHEDAGEDGEQDPAPARDAAAA